MSILSLTFVVFFIDNCEAAQMNIAPEQEEDVASFQMEEYTYSEDQESEAQFVAQNAEFADMDDIANRAAFAKNIESWEGFQYVMLEDFSENKRSREHLHEIQERQEFDDLMTEQMNTYRSFTSSTTVQQRMTSILESFQNIESFIDLISKSTDLNVVLPEEELVSDDEAITRFHPVAASLREIDDAMASNKVKYFFKRSTVADEKPVIVMYLFAQGVARIPGFLVAFQKFVVEFNKVRATNFKKVNLRKVNPPAAFNLANDAEKVIFAHNTELNRVSGWMDNSHVNILNAYRSRVIRQIKDQGKPNSLITLAVRSENWVMELSLLASAIEESQVFYPLMKAKDAGALEDFLKWLNHKDINEDSSFLEILENAGSMMYVAELDREKLKDQLIRFALQIASDDDGKFLAGLLHSMWMVRIETTNERLETMWNRNLYKLTITRGGKDCWRNWIQTQLLSVSNDDNVVKEIVKSTIEKATGIDRNQKRKTMPAVTIAQKLRNYSEFN
jgi:hypothetical protein